MDSLLEGRVGDCILTADPLKVGFELQPVRVELRHLSGSRSLAACSHDQECETKPPLGYRVVRNAATLDVDDVADTDIPAISVEGDSNTGQTRREGTASVRKRGGEDAGVMPLDRFLAEVTAEIRTRAVTSRIGPERG